LNYTRNIRVKCSCKGRGVRGGGRTPPPAPFYACPPERLRGGGIHGGGSFNITSACISLPQVRHSGVPGGGSSSLAPPLEVPKIQN